MALTDETASDETKSFIDYVSVSHPKQTRCRHSHWKLVLPWVLATCASTLFSVYLAISGTAHSNGPFPTDWKDAWKAVAYERRVFTGALQWDETRQVVFRDINASEPQYFGEPSPEIDAAWDHLLRASYPAMTPAEAALFLSPSSSPSSSSSFSSVQPLWDGAVHFAPAAYQSLRCLNAARMALDGAHYAQAAHETAHQKAAAAVAQPGWRRLHLDHCLDQLRQAVQCHADLSPVPLRTWAGFPLRVGVGTAHTCRDWARIRAWLDGRETRGGGSVSVFDPSVGEGGPLGGVGGG